MGTRGSSSHSGAGFFGRMPDYSNYYYPMNQSLYDAEIQHRNMLSFNRTLWESLSPAQRDAIKAYTGNYYSAMNDALFGTTVANAHIQSLIDEATNGMNHMTATFDFITFRGDAPEDIAKLLGGTNAQLGNASFLRKSIGKTVEFKGFMSTAIHIDKAWTFKGVTTIIRTPKGTEGFYVDPESAHRGEKEFLYQRGTQMKVVRIETNPFGRLNKIYLDVIPRKKRTK